MGSGSLRLRARAVTLVEQGTLVTQCFPGFKSRISGQLLTIEGEVQPSPRSPEYRLRITYRLGETPKVHVLSPPLGPREPGGTLPHVFPEDRLCLFAPSQREWSKDKSIAQTIVPWAVEWLFYYEIWFVTGEWLGGGIEHSGSKSESI